MKKKLSIFIFTVLIIFNFFAPFGIIFQSSSITVGKRVALADLASDKLDYPVIKKEYDDLVQQAYNSFIRGGNVFGDQTLTDKVKTALAKLNSNLYYQQLQSENSPAKDKDLSSPGSDGCTIRSAIFIPSGEQADWYKNSKGRSNLDIKVKSIGCKGQVLTLTVYEADTCLFNCDDAVILHDQSNSSAARHPFRVPVDSDNFTINLAAGEDECESQWSGAFTGYDCELFFYIRQGTGDHRLYNSWEYKDAGGRLKYDCDGLCITDFGWLGLTPNGSDDHPENIGASSEPEGTFNNVYTLLAPIPGLKCISTTGADATGVITDPNNPPCAKDNIGTYLNILFKIGIGLCGALAVIMIIIGGVQYMGTESVFGKTEAKGRIMSAILGLFIALAAYAILNTIDPALTGKNGVSIDQVNSQIDTESETSGDTGTYNPTGGNTKLCTDGFTTVNTFGDGTATSPKKISLCKSVGGITVASNFQNMINKAHESGIVLSGWGARTYEQQIQLRKDHNCPDIYNSLSTSCHPPTARPGHSNHEIGGAIDITCNGKSMVNAGGKNSVCFQWLATNASGYGFKNLSSEVWHWSFNGK